MACLQASLQLTTLKSQARQPGSLRTPGQQRLRQRASSGARVSRAGSLVVRADVSTVSKAEDAKSLVDEGYVIVDVRDITQYEKAHIPGSKHVPLFVLDDATDVGTVIKRQAHQNFAGNLYGLAFTKPNPKFATDVASLFPNKDAKILLVCQEGLRAASAADTLDDLGYTNVVTLLKGLKSVPPGVFPKEGPKELNEAGKGGFVAIQTQFSIALGSILVALLAFVSFFPDVAEKFLPQ